MKQRTLRLAILAAAFALALVPTAALAQGRGFGPGPGPHDGPGRHGRGPGPGPGMFHMLRGLDLTDQQETQIRALADEARKAIEPLREQLRDSRRAFHAALDPAAFDEAALRAQLKKDAAIEEEIAVIEGRTHAKAFALLTAAQQAELRKRRAARIDGRFGDDLD